MSLHLVQLVKATEIYEVILFNSQIQSHLSRCINIELVYNDTLKVSGHWPSLSGTNAKYKYCYFEDKISTIKIC